MPGIVHKLIRMARVVAAFAVRLADVVTHRPSTRRARAEWLSRFCGDVLRAVDITWNVRGPLPPQGAVISNHLTYIDVLTHSAADPCVFVSKVENRKIPLLGWISMMAGTVYVERGSGGSAAKAAVEMDAAFRDGVPITFFPEGGTFQGDQPLMPFRSGLLANAIAANAPVYYSYLVYRLSEKDRAEGRTERNDIHWGDVSLGRHLWNLMGLRGFHVELTFAPEPVPFSSAAIADRKIAALEAHAAILELAENQHAGNPEETLER